MFLISALLYSYKNGGERGIRTPGSLRLSGFQDRYLKPLRHLSKLGILKNNGGEGGIRTLGIPLSTHTLSKRAL